MVSDIPAGDGKIINLFLQCGGRKDNPKPGSTLFPQSGTMNLATDGGGGEGRGKGD
jgi:hypothetical protein